MKFGIFYELQLPRPWDAGDELRLYQNALTATGDPRTAAAIITPGWWSIISSRNIRTRRRRNRFWPPPASAPNRSGSGTASSSSTTNHPARVAERIAVLDLLSNGRAEFGMGESASITELTPFGRDMETKREVFEEAVQAIFPMFTKVGTEPSRQIFRYPDAQM